MEAVARARLVDGHLPVAARCAQVLHKRVGKYIELDELVALAQLASAGIHCFQGGCDFIAADLRKEPK